MKKILLLSAFLLTTLVATAQSATTKQAPIYGYLHVDSVLVALPEYKAQTAHLAELRKQYAAETERNEAEFKRQFAEYLSGQATFPPTILMKRQRDLQEAMEKNLAFRRESEELLRKAEADLRRPLRQRLMQAIATVATSMGLHTVVNLDAEAYVFLTPVLSVDVTERVVKQMTSDK